MGNSGSNKIHSKAESERINDYHHPSLQRVNPKAYNGAFKVLPERLPNQRLRATDNGQVLHNGGTLSGRRPTSISGIPDSSSSPQPPPLPPPLTEEELKQLLKKRHQQQRHSVADDSDSSFNRSRYIPESTQSNIEFRISKSSQQEVVSKKKHLFNRKSKAPAPPRYSDQDGFVDVHEERFKKSNKKDFASLLNSNRNSTSGGGDIDDKSSLLLPPPSQFVNSDVTANSKIDSKDKKSITYVLERREASRSPSSEGQRSSLSGIERGRYIKRANSPPENKYNGRINNEHPIVRGQLSDGGVHASTIDRSDSRQRMNESLQKRVRSMDSLVQNEVDIEPHGGQLLPSTRKELEERISKMSKHFNQSMDNIYLLSNINNDQARKTGQFGKLDIRPKTDGGGKPSTNSNLIQQETTIKPETNIRSHYYVGGPNREPFKLHDHKPMESPSTKRHPELKLSDDEVFDPPEVGFNYNKIIDSNKSHLKSKDNSRSFLPHNNRHSLSDTPEVVSDHLQEAFFAKTRETRSGVLEFNRKIGNNQSKKESNRALDHQAQQQQQDASSEDDMDIDMQLRPTLPKRHHAVPRFSPTHVWRSLVMEPDGRGDDRSSIHSSDAEEEGDVYEDRIQRVARPVAPPKNSNEKSADSGISPGAVSPLPVAYEFEINDKCRQTPNKTNTASSSPSSNNNVTSKGPVTRTSSSTQNNATSNVVKDRFSLLTNQQQQRDSATVDKKCAAWTPEEDLASDFDAGSGEIPAVIVETRQPTNWGLLAAGPELVPCSHPKLTTRKEMFGNKLNLLPNDDDAKLIKGSSNTHAHNEEDITGSSTAQTFNSVRKLKRSLSGVIQNNIRNRNVTNGVAGETIAEVKHTNLDDNWSLSRSLPNSLHNGHEGEKLSEYRVAKKPVESRNHRFSHHEKSSLPPLQNSHIIDKGRGFGITNYHFQPRLNRSESGPVFFAGSELSSLTPDGNSIVQSRPFTDLEGRAFNSSRSSASHVTTTAAANAGGKNRVMYLPKYEAMQIIDEKPGNKPERKAYSDLGTRTETNIPPTATSSATLNKKDNGHQNKGKTKKGKKFTYQSTVRQIERKQLEQKLSREVALEEKRRADEIALVNKVEEEFQKKRDREKVSIRQQLRILNMKDDNGAEDNNDDVSDDEDETEGFQQRSPEFNNELHSLPWDHPRHHVTHNYDDGPASLPLQPTLHIPPVDYELSSNPKRNHNGLSSAPYRDTAQPSQSSSGFFGGISKWMKKQPSKVENGHRNEGISRLEPEGAPSAFTVQDGNGSNRQPSPQQESRGRAITGSKFSSGRSPDISFGAPRRSIYSQLAQVAAKEKQLEKQVSEKDSRTSVWISPDKTYPSPTSPSKLAMGHNSMDDRVINGYYQMPFDNIEQPLSLNGGPRDFHYYPSSPPMGHSSMPFELSNSSNKRLDDDNRYFHGGVPPPQDMLHRGDWKSTGGQRHSIAIDTSSSSSRGGGGGGGGGGSSSGGQWMMEGFRNPDGSSSASGGGRGRSKSPSNNNPSHQVNGHPSAANNYPHEYRPPNPANGGDYRKNQNSSGLNSNHRSLSFSHIPAINYGGQSKSPRIPVPTLVQPYNPNKAYRPVPFYSSNPYDNRK